MKVQTKAFGAWVSDLSNLQKVVGIVVMLVSSGFGAGIGAAATFSRFSGLPETVASIKATQDTLIVPRLQAVEEELSIRAPNVAQVPNNISRLERIEDLLGRMGCVMDAGDNDAAARRCALRDALNGFSGPNE